MSATVVLNDCAGSPAGAIDVRWRLTQYNQASNWTFDYSKLASHLPRALLPVEQDWLEVFGALYAVDRVVERKPGVWTREIQADIPVRDPASWNAQAPLLRDVWNRLTGDRLTVRFHQETSPLAAPRTDSPVPTGVTGVALFSGGLDSFACVAQLAKDGEKPALVTHRANPSVDGAVRKLLARLPTVPRPAPLPVLARNGAGSGLRTDESQRARSLLYIASATLAAKVFDVRPVLVGENGILAVHEPETEARVPSLSTRTAHPQVLAALQTLASAILGDAVEITNPLERFTKAGVVRLCDQLGHGAAVVDAVSCWKISRTGVHCGHCIPCLQRFVATQTAGVPDPVYVSNPWQQEGPASTAADELDNLVHFIQLAQAIARASDFDLELERPALIGVGGALTDSERMALHRVWANEVLTVAGQYPRSSSLL